MKREDEIDEKQAFNHYLFERLAFVSMLLINYYCMYLCMYVYTMCVGVWVNVQVFGDQRTNFRTLISLLPL